jgi:hypothetical protein
MFILPVRSKVARRHLGDRQAIEVRRRAHRLVDELGVRLFAPMGPWPDNLFIDHAHLNGAGRARLQSEFRQWWAGQR